MSFWCNACSIRAMGESIAKSQISKYTKNSYALEKGDGGLKFHNNEK